MWSKVIKRSFSASVPLKDWTAANVANWVSHVHGRRYAAYSDAFLRHEIDIELLGQLSDLDLRQLGVANLSDRKMLLSSVAKLVSFIEKGEESPKAAPTTGVELQAKKQVTRRTQSEWREEQGPKDSPRSWDGRHSRPWQEQLIPNFEPSDEGLGSTPNALLSSTPVVSTTPWDRPVTLPHSSEGASQVKRIKVQTQARVLPNVWSQLENRHQNVTLKEIGGVEEFDGEPRYVYGALVDVYDHFRRLNVTKVNAERVKRPDYLYSIKSLEEFRLALVNHEESLFSNSIEVLGEKLLALYEANEQDDRTLLGEIIDAQPLLVRALLGAAAVRGVVLAPELGLQMLPHLAQDPLVWADFWDVAVDASNRDTVCVSMLKFRLLETGKNPFWKAWLEGLATRKSRQPRPLAHALLALETLHESTNYIWTLDRLGWTHEEKLSQGSTS